MFLGGRKTRCHRVRGMFSEYIDNCLGSEERGVVERHLGMCEACSRELESLQMTVGLLHQVPEMPAPRSFVVREVDIGRVSIFDQQRLRWLRPATAFATVALIVLLMLDFFQVVPHDVVMLLPTPEGEAYTTEARGDEPAETITEPGPAPTEKALTGDAGSVESDLGGTYDGEEQMSGESAVGWPLRQIEIAMGALVFAMVALMFFARWQRRR